MSSIFFIVQQRHVENIIPIISEKEILTKNNISVITSADNDAGRDEEVETVAGDELDSLAKAALECIGRVIFLNNNQSMKYLSKIYIFINNSFELWGDCT